MSLVEFKKADPGAVDEAGYDPRVQRHARNMYPARRAERIFRFVMDADLIYMAVHMVMILQIRLNAF